MGLLAEYREQVSSKSLEEIQLFYITSWVFYSPRSVSLLFALSVSFIEGLWLFIKSLKYGLIISRYSPGDKFSYLSPLILYSM